MKKLLSLLLSVCMVCSFAVPALAAEDATDIALTGIEATSASVSPYPDAQGHWAESSINRWSLSGIVQGDELGNMNPNKLLTRGEFAAMLVRLLGLETKAANAFADLKGTEWYTDDILKVAAAGIMLGDGKGNCNGGRPISRQETMVMFARAMGLKPVADPDLSKFSDAADVADWAAGYIAPLADMGIINGVVPGQMVAAPKNNINRASTLALLDKAIKTYITAAGEYTVDAPKGFVVVNVPDAQVSLTGNAAGVVVAAGSVNADVTAKDLDADALKVDAAADVTLDGKTAVDAVALNDKANLVVNKDASVTDLDANAAAQIVNNGQVTNLNTNESGVTYDGNAPEKVNTAPDVEAAKDSDGKVVTEGTGSGDNGGSTVTPSRPVVKADLVVAPLVDQAQANAIPTEQLGTVKVDSRKTTGTTYNVTLTGKDIMNHTNAQPKSGHWVGFGMPAKAAKEDDPVKNYTYLVGDTAADAQEVPTIAGRTYTDPKTNKVYNTVYFSYETEAEFNTAKQVVLVKDGDKTVATYNVSFKVDFYKAKDVTVKAKLTNAAGEAHPFNDLYSMAAIGATVKQTGYDFTLTGEIDPEKLNNDTGKTEKEYTYYYLTVGDANIATITGVATADGDTGAADEDYVMAARIFDVTNKQLLKATHAFQLKDANGRLQDTIAVTVDATGCSVKGMEQVTVKFVDGATEVKTQTLLSGAAIVPPADPTKDGFYFVGWTDAEGNLVDFTGLTATADVTYTAKFEEVKPQTMKLRANGPEDDVDPFPYADTYAAAGITFDETTHLITLDAAQLVKYKATPNNQLDHLFGQNNSKTLYVGLEYTAPATATQYAWAATLEGLRSETLAPLSNHTQSTYGNALITYIAFAKFENDAFTFLDDVTDNADNKLESTPYILWADAGGNVVGVTCATLSLKTVNKPAAPVVPDPETVTVTFVDGTTTTENKELTEGKATVTLPKPKSTENYFLGWKMGDAAKLKAAGTQVEITADTTFTAQYVTVGAQELKTRPNGPANNGETDCDYGAVYTAAGVVLSGTPAEYTYTIDANTFNTYAAANDNKLGVLAATVGGKTYYFYGAAIMAPEGAAKLIITDDKNMSSLDDAAKRSEFALNSSEQHYFTIENKGCILHYFGAVAATDGNGYEFQPDGAFTRYTMWLKDDGTILAVNKLVLKRVTNGPTTPDEGGEG